MLLKKHEHFNVEDLKRKILEVKKQRDKVINDYNVTISDLEFKIGNYYLRPFKIGDTVEGYVKLGREKQPSWHKCVIDSVKIGDKSSVKVIPFKKDGNLSNTSIWIHEDENGSLIYALRKCSRE